jgi:hypothetical protein
MIRRFLIVLILMQLVPGPLAWAADISSNHWSETDSSNNHASPNGWTSGNMLPSQVEPTARGMMGAVKRFYNHINGTVTSGGTANAQTLTYSIAPSAYVTGDVYTFLVGSSLTNTGATTLNINSLGAIAVQQNGVALGGGELAAGRYVSVLYDGTNFQLVANSPYATAAFPSSFGSTPSNTQQINVGSFPAASEIPAGVLQGLAVKVAVPSSFTAQPWPATAISAYITNNNTASASASASAIFSFAGQTIDTSGTQWGLNTITANCASVGCTTGSGHQNGNIIGAEFDLNEMKVGATTPIGQVVGIFLTGSSEVVPTNGAYGIRVKQLGAGVPWTVGYQTDNGAATNGVIIGAAAASGAANSQPLTWSANSGSPIFMSAALDQNQYLEFTGTPDVGGIIALNVQGRNSFKIGSNSGSGVNALTLGGGFQALYGDLGTAAVLLGNTSAQNLYRNTTHIFQNIAGNANFATLTASSLNLGSGVVYASNGTNGVSCAANTINLTTAVATNGILTHC